MIYLIICAVLIAPAACAELRGTSRPLGFGVPKGQKCNVSESDARIRALFSDPACTNLKIFVGNMSDPKVEALPVEVQATMLDDFCSKDPCASKFDKAVSTWRQWCATDAATAADSSTFPIPENTTVIASAAPLWITVMKYGCSKTPQLGYCAPYVVSVNQTIAALPVPRNGTIMKGALCPFLTSCCVALNVQWRPRTDTELDTFERLCPGSRAASMGATC